MLFVKSCFKKDNIFSRKTIRIGTLDDYRLTENAQIADSLEGNFKFDLDLEDAHVDIDVFNIINKSHHGFSSTYVKDLFICCQSHAVKNAFFLKTYKSTINLRNNNRFIFCMSHLERHEDSVDIFKDYDDYWYFNASIANKICIEMSLTLKSEVIRNEMNGCKVFAGDYDVRKLIVNCSLQQINYKNRHMYVDNETFYKNQKEICQSATGVSFIKPDSYQHEKEVRFIFDFYHDYQLLTPILKSLIIPVNDIFLFLLRRR